MALAQIFLSVFTELNIKFLRWSSFQCIPRSFFFFFLNTFTTPWRQDDLNVSREYFILGSLHCPKKEAMASGCRTLSSRSSTVTHHSKPFIFVSTEYAGLFPFLYFLRVWLCLLLPQSPQGFFFFSVFQQQWISYLALSTPPKDDG